VLRCGAQGHDFGSALSLRDSLAWPQHRIGLRNNVGGLGGAVLSPRFVFSLSFQFPKFTHPIIVGTTARTSVEKRPELGAKETFKPSTKTLIFLGTTSSNPLQTDAVAVVARVPDFDFFNGTYAIYRNMYVHSKTSLIWITVIDFLKRTYIYLGVCVCVCVHTHTRIQYV
jgi:hypothetical protein